jgi:hypothetical protein
MKTLLRYALLVGVLFGIVPTVNAVNSTTFLTIPATGASGGLNQVTEVLSTANEMRCTAFVPSIGITNATEMAFYTVAGTASAVGVCIYDASGNPVATTGALTCGANTLCTKTGMTAFTLNAGFKYYLCWTSSDTTVTLAGAGAVPEDVVNVSVKNHGTGNAGSSGVCSGTMGTLSSTLGTTKVPFVFLSEE